MIPELIPIWISIIGNFGFPIAITIYLFARFERKLDNLEAIIKHLSDVIKADNKKQMMEVSVIKMEDLGWLVSAKPEKPKHFTQNV